MLACANPRFSSSNSAASPIQPRTGFSRCASTGPPTEKSSQVRRNLTGRVFRTSPNGILPLESLILSRAAFHSRLAPFAAVIIMICSAACTVPLAPGYAISKESREIQFVSGAAPELKIRGQFTLVNSGASKLNFIDVVVPVEKAFGMNDLRVEVNGHEVTAVPLP